MSTPGDVPGRLSIMPDDIGIEDYANPDIIDMMIWRHVFKQRDELVIRAWKRGQDKSKIAETMGIGRTTVWRVIGAYLEDGGD